MEQQLKLEGISLVLIEEGDAIRVISLLPKRNVLLSSQNMENVIQIIEGNFRIVDSFYLKRIEDNPKTTFVLDDIHFLSVSMVLHYLYIYNMWRLDYKRKKYQDLAFKQDDFKSPSTNDIIFGFFKYNYPDDWEIKCSVLMAMELDDLKTYYERRVQFYNK
jgi:hypothetical protein